MFCHQCGVVVVVGATFCFNCGVQLTQISSLQNAHELPPSFEETVTSPITQESHSLCPTVVTTETSIDTSENRKGKYAQNGKVKVIIPAVEAAAAFSSQKEILPKAL
eukprot:Awhi_evm1s3131